MKKNRLSSNYPSFSKHLTFASIAASLAREERLLLTEASALGHDVHAYMYGLDQLLTRRIEMWSDLKQDVVTFLGQLKKE